MEEKQSNRKSRPTSGPVCIQVSANLFLFIASHAYHHSQRPTIDVLPDDTLLEIFNLYRLQVSSSEYSWMWPWRKLIHVSQRWRHIVFSSPRRLHVGLLCKPGTPVKKNLGIWPALPIIMRYGTQPVYFRKEEENLVAALRHPDRIQKIELLTANSVGDVPVAEMRKTMPLLESLDLTLMRGGVLPDDFLGGSAPALRQVVLDCVAFPALPKFLLSTINLVTLKLLHYPHSEYFSPEALVMGLSASMRLEILVIHFPMLLPDTGTFPMERTVLPSLTNLTFHGFIEYFDNFVARIDTPLIELIHLRFHNENVIKFPHLHDFICRTRQLGSPTHAEIRSCKLGSDPDASIVLLHGPMLTYDTPGPGQLRLDVSMTRPKPVRHLSVISQLSCQLLPFLSEVPQLHIYWFDQSRILVDASLAVIWAEILRRFSRIEGLHVLIDQGPNIALALRQAASELDPGFLPALRKVLLIVHSSYKQYRELLEPFIKARQLSGNPVD